MSETGSLIYFRTYHEGDGTALQFPKGVQGFGLLLAGIHEGQQPPDQLAIDYLLASVAIYRFELIMAALNLDEAASIDLVAKINKILDDNTIAKKKESESLIQKPKLVLVP